MRKTLIACALTFATVVPTFAQYTLTQEEQTLVQSVIVKLQQKPVRSQESMIMMLKNGVNKTSANARKKAIFSAIETGLRTKVTLQGKTSVLATKLEREQIKKSFVTENIDQKDGSITLDVSGKLTSTSTPKVVTFDTHMAVDVDMNDLKNPKVRLAVDASGAADTENMSGSAEMRVVDTFGFFKFATLTSTSPDIRDELVALQPYLNIWWKVPLSQSDIIDIGATKPAAQSDGALGKILLTSNILPVLQYMGQEKGVSTYGGTVDNKALLVAIKEIALSEGQEISDQDMLDVEKMLKSISIFTEFSLTDKNIFTALNVKTTILPTLVAPGNSIQGAINVDMTLSPLKSPIVAPANAKELNEEALMGL